MNLLNDERHVGIFRLISKERNRQEQLKREGRFRYTPADAGMGNAERLACVMEEVGEVAKEVLTHEGRRLARDTTGTVEGMRKELIQVAALCVAWLESDCNPMAIYEGMPAVEAEVIAKRPMRCPTCNSSTSDRFPATAFEGEALGCGDEWHLTDPQKPPSETTRSLVERSREDLRRDAPERRADEEADAAERRLDAEKAGDL